jgi:hypothetical protein
MTSFTLLPAIIQGYNDNSGIWTCGHLTTLSSVYFYQLIAGIDHVPYHHPLYKLVLLRLIHEYARGVENICLAYYRRAVTARESFVV